MPARHRPIHDDLHDDDRQLVLELPVAAASVAIARGAAAQFAEEVGLGEAASWRVRLAVSEAVSNVVQHAHAERAPGHRFALLAARLPDRMVVTVSDVGGGFRARGTAPGLGVGMAIIARAADEHAVRTGPSGGTAVTMAFASG